MDLALTFCMSGYSCHLFDFRGFGYSGGMRRNTKIPDLLEDLHLVLKECDAELPLFFFCHSLGSLVCLKFMILNPLVKVSGIIASSLVAGYMQDRPIGILKLLIVEFLGMFDFIMINSNYDPTSCSKDNYHIKKSSLFFFGSLLTGIRLTKSFFKSIKFV
jgi:acylglycerol lipase